MKNKKVIIRTVAAFFIALFVLLSITDAFPDLDIILQVLIGGLLFLSINTAAKYIPIKDIIAKL